MINVTVKARELCSYPGRLQLVGITNEYDIAESIEQWRVVSSEGYRRGRPAAES